MRSWYIAFCTCSSTALSGGIPAGVCSVTFNITNPCRVRMGAVISPAFSANIWSSSTFASLPSPRLNSPSSPPVSAVGPSGILLHQVLKLGAGLQLRDDLVRLGLCLRNLRVGWVVRRWNQNLAQPHLLRLRELLLVLVVVGLLLLGGQAQIPADFVADDLLSDDVVLDGSPSSPQTRCPIRAPPSRRSSMVSKWFCLRISSSCRITSESALISSSLPRESRSCCVDHVAQQVFLLLCHFGRASHCRCCASSMQLLLGALVVAVVDDLVVYADDRVLHHVDRWA